MCDIAADVALMGKALTFFLVLAALPGAVADGSERYRDSFVRLGRFLGDREILD